VGDRKEPRPAPLDVKKPPPPPAPPSKKDFNKIMEVRFICPVCIVEIVTMTFRPSEEGLEYTFGMIVDELVRECSTCVEKRNNG
jgi:hypothetical protein